MPFLYRQSSDDTQTPLKPPSGYETWCRDNYDEGSGTELGITIVSPTTLPVAGGTVTVTGTYMTLVDDDGPGTGQVYLHDRTHGSYYYADSYTIVSDSVLTFVITSWVAPTDVGDVMDLTVSDQNASVNTSTFPSAITVVA
jgi:hypothetical protein